MNEKDLINIDNLYMNDMAKDRKVLMDVIEDYADEIKKEYGNMPSKLARDSLLSEYNYKMRSKLKSCRPLGMTIDAGDICYIDFGRAYLTEIGYQHFGLVLNVYYGKAFVVPMTSNAANYHQAYDRYSNPDGSHHLMRIGLIEGLTRYSVLFLNDAKFINTARIIEIKAHIDTDSEMFAEVRRRVVECITK